MKFVDIEQEEKNKLLKLVRKHDWTIIMKEYPYMIRLKKEFDYSMVFMNIFWNKKGVFTKVATYMNHPKKGKTQLFRPIKNVTELETYLSNPRAHTKVGYSKKSKQ